MNGYYPSTNFIGALGEYPIFDYIDSNSSNFTTTTSNILQNNIINTSNDLQIQITDTCNLIYKDAEKNTIVRMTAQNPFYPFFGNPIETQFQNVNGECITKIIQTGELMVYHPLTPLPVGYGPGWWSVENKLANIIQDTIGLRFDVIQLQSATGAAAITDSAAATAAVAGAAGGLASAGAATAVSGATIAGGDYGSVALGIAGGTLFSVLGYLSYQAQIASNLTSNGFLTEASQVKNNINSANILLTDNISNICVAKGFITSNIKTPQLIPYLTTNTIKLNNKVITTLALKDIDNFVQTQYGTYYDVTNGSLAINATPNEFDFFSVGGQTTIQGELIAEGKIKENSLYLSDVYISSNILQIQNYINSNSVANITSFYISSNILQTQNYINSNSVELNYITSNQIYKKTDTYSVEQQYPSKLYDSFTIQTATTFLGQASLQESITLNSTGISYGVGQYDIYVSSSSLMSNRAGKQLFNYILNEEADSCHFTSVYNASGFYTGTADYIINGYYGDWCIIKLPNPIILTKFAFYMRPTQTTRAPSLWKCYGSIDGITFTEIVEASNSTALTPSSYTVSKYQKILNTTFNTPYLYIGFCYKKITGSGGILNFAEIQIFGKELIGTPIYVSSNILQIQNYINSNSVANITSFYISSNILQTQNFINSNSVALNYINSNTVPNILSPYITSNVLSYQNFINSNSVAFNYVNSNIVPNLLTPCITSNALTSVLFSYLPLYRIFIPNTNSYYDPTHLLYVYDLQISKYVKTFTFTRDPGMLIRVFEITTIIENTDWDYANQVFNQGFFETITIYMSNFKFVSGAGSVLPNFCNGKIIGKQNNTNIGYWNTMTDTFEYIRFLSKTSWDLNVSIRPLF